MLILFLKCSFNEINLLIVRIRTVVCRFPPDFAGPMRRSSETQNAPITPVKSSTPITWFVLATVRMNYIGLQLLIIHSIFVRFLFTADGSDGVGGVIDNSSPCVYDEGSPLVQYGSAVGIMSKNKGCSAASAADGIIRPTIYTRLTAYYAWLRTNAGQQPATTLNPPPG